MKNRWLSYGVAILLWLACVYELVFLGLRAFWGALEETPVFGRLLTRGGDSVAALAILAVVVWLLLEILLHAIRVWREQAAVKQFKNASLTALKSISLPARTRAGRRLMLVRGTNPLSREHLQDVMAATAALDAGALDNSYSLTKTYVWVLPVLGFIGTAWGMAHAIGGFSQALGETQDVKLLADRLGQLVIPGLSNAFSVTMLALGAAIVTHFCVTTVESWDQDTLDQLDHASVALLGAIPRGAGGDRGGSSPELVFVLQMISQQLQQLSAKIDITDATGQLATAAEVLSGAAQELGGAAGEIRGSVKMPYYVTITREEQR